MDVLVDVHLSSNHDPRIIYCILRNLRTIHPPKARRPTQKINGDPRYYTARQSTNKSESILSLLLRTLSRPVRLLIFHPIIQITALISAFNYGILYIVLSSFADLWTQQYNLSVELSGLHYIAIALGELAGALLAGPLMDRMYACMISRSSAAAANNNNSQHVPENRIPLGFPFSILRPLGLFIYGWSAQFRLRWAIVDLGIFISMFGSQIAGMPLTAYIVDSYPEHTSSALAATEFLKSMTAFLFPLFVPSMYGVLGYGWGNSSLGFAGLLIGLPAPFLMWKFGARLRARGTSSW